MGLRFRKSFKLFPGVRLNLSKTGISTSLGTRGATINLSKRGARGTVGIPGSGFSWSERLGGGSTRRQGMESYQTSPLAQSEQPYEPERAKRSFNGCTLLLISIIVIATLIAFIGGRGEERSNKPPSEIVAATSHQPMADMLTIKASAANCRAKPSSSGKIIAKITQGEEVKEIDRNNRWTQVFDGDNTCWISSDLLQ